MSRSNDLASLADEATGGISKAEVGLGNVDNTADSAKPVSTAQQTALDAKANKSGDTFTGNVIVNKAGTATEPTMRVTSALESSSGIHSHGFSATFLNTSNNANSHGVAIGSKHADSNSLIVGQHDTTFDHFIVKGDGNVGVGVDPATKLHVYDSADHTRLSVQCANSSGRHWQFQSRNDGKFWIRDDTAGANRMVFDTAGNVGIGVTTPSTQLEIEGSAPIITLDTSNSDPGMQFARSGTVGYQMKLNSSNNLYFYNNSTKMTLDSSGNLGIGGTYTGFTPTLYVTGTTPAIIAQKDATNFVSTVVGSGKVTTLFDDSADYNIATSSNLGGTGESIKFTVKSNGMTDHNGMKSYVRTFYQSLSSTVYYQFDIDNSVQYFYIKAMIGYYPGSAYTATYHVYAAFRSDSGIGVVNTLLNQSHANSGSWSLSDNGVNQITVTKTGGNSTAMAKGFIEIKWRDAT